MNRESTFWSVVTALALTALLVLFAQQKGLFGNDDVETNLTSTNPSSDDLIDAVEDSESNQTNTNNGNEATEEPESNQTNTNNGNETTDDSGSSNETNTTGNLSSSADTPDPLALDCVEHGELPRHDHVTLQVFIDGSAYTVESDIGIRTDVCTGDDSNSMHTIHTHDDTGKLHVELNDPGDISLGVFFDIWGHHFNETGIFDYRINATHEMVMYVHASGESASEDNRVTSFDDYLLQNGEVIEVHYRAKAN